MIRYNKMGVIDLGDGYGLIIPRKTDNIKIMVAIGLLVQMWVYAEIDQGEVDPDKLKLMCNEWIDEMLNKIMENCIKGD